MRRISFLIATVLMLQMASAQDVNKLRMGFTLNPGVSWLSAGKKPVEKAGSATNIGLGVVADYFFAENYGISTGIGISFGNGGTLNYPGDGLTGYNAGLMYSNSDLSDELKALNKDTIILGSVKTKYRFQMIEVPFGFRFKSNEIGLLTYYIEPGILLGVKTGAKGTITAQDGKEYSRENIGKDVGIVNLSWGVGAGVYYNVSDNTSLVAGLQFYNGFTDMTRDNKGVNVNGKAVGADNTKSVLNRLSLKLGVMF